MAAPVHVQVGADHRGGFPSLLWDTLREFGYIEPPKYVGREYIELGLHRCEVVLDIPSTPAHPGWAPWRVVAYGNELTDTWEIAAFEALTKFCEKHQEEIAGTPAAVFPFRGESVPQLMAPLMDLDATIPETNLMGTIGRYNAAMYNLCQLRNAENRVILDRVHDYHIQIDRKNEQLQELNHQIDRNNERIRELREKLKLKETKLKEAKLKKAKEQEQPPEGWTVQLG
ncbi:unnamed protein product [Urochloa humidicola]